MPAGILPAPKLPSPSEVDWRALCAIESKQLIISASLCFLSFWERRNFDIVQLI